MNADRVTDPRHGVVERPTLATQVIRERPELRGVSIGSALDEAVRDA